MLWRWAQSEESKRDLDFAPLKVFEIIGYGKTASSPVEAEPLKYLLPTDKKIMNRNSLFSEAKKVIEENKNNKPSNECTFKLSGKSVLLNYLKVE